MAQRLVDDLEPAKFAERTVTFCLDGSIYDIDLGEDNIKRLEGVLEPFIAAGRPRTAVRAGIPARARLTSVNGSKSHKTAPGRAEQLAAIRDWARQQGYEVSERGRIPEAVQDAFDSAHSKDGEKPVPTFSSPV